MAASFGPPWRYRDGWLRLRETGDGAGRALRLEYRHVHARAEDVPLFFGPDDALPGGELAGAAVLKRAIRCELDVEERDRSAAFVAQSRRERAPR